MINPLKAIYKGTKLFVLLKNKDKNFDQEHSAHYQELRKDEKPEGYTHHKGIEHIPYSPVHQFQNWDVQIVVKHLHIFRPLDTNQCVDLANYACKHKSTIRPFGKMHGWAPLAIGNNEVHRKTENEYKVLFVDTGNLKRAYFELEDNIPTATFGAGMTVLEANQFLQNVTDAKHPHGYSFVNMTGPGELSIGGVLAIGGHGTSIPFEGNPHLQFCGSLSNLVRSFKAIVSVADENGKVTYVEKQFKRSDEDAAAFLVHLGRAFITEATMQVVPNYFLEVSNLYPNASELFEAPAKNQSVNALQTLVEKYGRLEVIYFPFTKHPWVKVWKEVNNFTQNPVSGPYNYKFANCISAKLSADIQKLFTDDPDLTPILTWVFLKISQWSKHGSENWIMSGLAKDLLLYVQDHTLRITALGYVVQIRRSDIQETTYKYITKYNEMLQKYKKQDKFPINSPLEIRFTGLDDPTALKIYGARSPLLAASSPMKSNPEIDTVFWVDILTMPQTSGVAEFFVEMEEWMYETWPNMLRPEWSKGWGFDETGGWQSKTVLKKWIPEFYAHTIHEAQRIFTKYDQCNIYTNRLLSEILPAVESK